uniref:Uncharacterized protein n=1 Tax=Anopheles coluzzii TaxID=1518534 RepID=A0A8W7PUY4_ANOCL
MSYRSRTDDIERNSRRQAATRQSSSAINRVLSSRTSRLRREDMKLFAPCEPLGCFRNGPIETRERRASLASDWRQTVPSGICSSRQSVPPGWVDFSNNRKRMSARFSLIVLAAIRPEMPAPTMARSSSSDSPSSSSSSSFAVLCPDDSCCELRQQQPTKAVQG